MLSVLQFVQTCFCTLLYLKQAWKFSAFSTYPYTGFYLCSRQWTWSCHADSLCILSYQFRADKFQQGKIYKVLTSSAIQYQVGKVLHKNNDIRFTFAALIDRNYAESSVAPDFCCHSRRILTKKKGLYSV